MRAKNLERHKKSLTETASKTERNLSAPRSNKSLSPYLLQVCHGHREAKNGSVTKNNSKSSLKQSLIAPSKTFICAPTSKNASNSQLQTSYRTTPKKMSQRQESGKDLALNSSLKQYPRRMSDSGSLSNSLKVRPY